MIYLTLIVIFCSLALQVFQVTKTNIKRRIDYAGGVAFYIDDLHYGLSNEEQFIHILVTQTIGLWVPLLLVILVHIAMFIELRKRAQIRAQSTSTTNNQMQRTMRLFLVIVLAFFACSMPYSILNCLMYYPGNLIGIHAKSTDYNNIIRVRNVCVPLAFLNSCLNPYIYSKAHLKIFSGLRWVYAKVHTWIFIGVSKRVESWFARSQTPSRASEMRTSTNPRSGSTADKKDDDGTIRTVKTNRNEMDENFDAMMLRNVDRNNAFYVSNINNDEDNKIIIV